MPPMHQNNSILLDLNASNASELLTATTAAAAAVSQELWNLGRALVRRAQELNIPFGESLTSIIFELVFMFIVFVCSNTFSINLIKDHHMLCQNRDHISFDLEVSNHLFCSAPGSL